MLPTPMKTLVVYFCHNGHTTRMAREIAKRCDGDLEPIRELQGGRAWRDGPRRYWQMLVRAEPPIKHPLHNPARYDLVVIGTPVWQLGVPPPMRSYVRQYGDRFTQVAFFCVEGGVSEERGFVALGRLCGRQPVATFAVARKGLPPAAHKEGLTDFMDRMRMQ